MTMVGVVVGNSSTISVCAATLRTDIDEPIVLSGMSVDQLYPHHVRLRRQGYASVRPAGVRGDVYLIVGDEVGALVRELMHVDGEHFLVLDRLRDSPRIAFIARLPYLPIDELDDDCLKRIGQTLEGLNVTYIEANIPWTP